MKGDINAFENLVERYEKRLFTVAVRMLNNEVDAREVVIIVFEKTFFALKTYKKQYKFSTWLYRILLNEVYDFLKQKKRQSLQPLPLSLGHLQDPSKELEKKEFWAAVSEALMYLSSKERATFVLSVFNRISVDEIADMHNCPRGTVCWRLFQARSKMAKILKMWK
ncbi:RNA polymerase sigma factor [Candidatus Uabimicrobium sp. HlEnr_7]|uniref:RNA polymerase sigma factor n=1 Tax=Candidatus Uabimicrobium helgolandensis TaxID=3095367 RepID=UPI003558D1FB